MTDEIDLDDLEKGDKVRHVDDPAGKTRAVISEPEVNPLAGGVVSVDVHLGTISQDNADKWELVEKADQ